MNGIAAGLPIAIAVLALNAPFPPGTLAAESSVQPARMTAPADAVPDTRGTRVLALLVALQALSASPAPKV